MADTATTANVAVASRVTVYCGPLALSELKQQAGKTPREAEQRAAIDALIGARLEMQEAERQALAMATAERALQQAKMARGGVAYRVEVVR